ncbi:Ankyrin repeat-containing protein [Apiospora marii]|uniref:Ankyrin repeat-containing protein n=1 Tax=Apiospora marii TaxID=335849 RepID=A0ABR1RHG0_9PEZI
MQLLELPLDVFRLIIRDVVRDQGRKSIKSRVVCRVPLNPSLSTFAGIFDTEVLDAVITTGAIEDIAEHDGSLQRLKPHFDVIARYLHHRVCADGPDTHPWIRTIRKTCERLADHRTPSRPLIAARGDPNQRLPLLGPAWMGDLKVVQSLLLTQAPTDDESDTPLDPPSFFGRPSWAAAAGGHLRIYQWFLKRGAMPYEPPTSWNNDLVLGENPLVAAAHLGHDSIVRAILQADHPETRREVSKATKHAAYANQPQTLRTLLEDYRRHPDFSQAKLRGRLDYNLAFCSCRRGAADATRVLLEYGADPDATDYTPRSCLQLAAKSGDARTVRLLLEAGASLEAPGYRRNRIDPEIDSDRRDMNQPKRKRRDALEIAKKRNWPEIVRLIEAKEREIEQSTEENGTNIEATV